MKGHRPMRYALFACLLSLCLALPAQAATTPDPATLPEVKVVEDYLNGLSTLKARFVQTTNDGKSATGFFMLKRPGKMRFQYDPPVTDFIVADGTLIYYYDGKMKEQSSAPISKSLADFFLRKNLKLAGDIKVSGVKRDRDMLLVTLVEARDPLSGSMTLVLQEKPELVLKRWRIVDTQGGVTEVELKEPVAGIKLDNDYFRYYNPSRTQPKYN
jgi:outer membrane lipoprotein-sorting protein